MFNKKVTAAAIMTAAMAAFAATGVFAESVDKVDVEGVKFEIPAEFKDLLTVTTEGLEDGTLVSVSETASIEAAKANGSPENQIESAGWLFSISRISEDEMKNIRCGMTDGQEIFAEGEDVYYVFNHPTDVRLIREQYDDIDEDLAQWSRLNEWANDAVCGEIVANNPELEEENHSYTELDSRLCKIL